MLEVRDPADAVLLGLFLFGLLLTGATLLLGVADLGVHHAHADDTGPLPVSPGAFLVFLSWLGGVSFVPRRRSRHCSASASRPWCSELSGSSAIPRDRSWNRSTTGCPAP